MAGFQQAVILHRRLYRETSMLLELLTENLGYCTVLAKGVQGNHGKYKTSRAAGLQPFNLLQVNLKHNKNNPHNTDQLGLLLDSEVQHTIILTGRYLIAGLYLNELLTQLLRTQAAIDLDLLKPYWQAITKLEHAVEYTQILLILRQFECELLKQLGFELNLKSVIIKPDCFYQYDWEKGLCLAESNDASEASELESSGELAKITAIGQSWLAYQAQQFENQTISRLAQKLFSQVLFRYCEFSTARLKTRALWSGRE